MDRKSPHTRRLKSIALHALLAGVSASTMASGARAEAEPESHSGISTVPSAQVTPAGPPASTPTATEPPPPPAPKKAEEPVIAFPKSGLSVGASYLSGEPGKLLVGKGRGYGASLEAMARRGGNTLQYVGRVRLGAAVGMGSFTVDGADTGLNFQLLTGDVLAGVRINLMPHENTVLQPYFEIAGKYGLTCLLLPGLEGTSTQVSRVNTGRLMGLEWIAGIELNRRSFVEFQLRGGAGSVGATTEFQVNSGSIAFGLLW